MPEDLVQRDVRQAAVRDGDDRVDDPGPVGAEEPAAVAWRDEDGGDHRARWSSPGERLDGFADAVAEATYG
ncbi:hypothetical protein [Actinokineospora diospyrosa]|uniref:hypothetical protein n=1 Tax=Actinokineospora diospyrosa TaxID=103728 RepID=UPI0020A56BC5|nr:hypothetical protein [Actinokineospora diospyrosa]